MNIVVLTGNLTKDPEIRYSGEMPIANWTLAVDKDTRNGGTDYVWMTAFNKTATNAESFLKKGRLIEVTGHIDVSTYEKEGKKQSRMNIICDRWRFLGSAPKEEANPEKTGQTYAAVDDDDIPF